MDQALDKQGCSPLSTKCALHAEAHMSECRAHYRAQDGIKELAAEGIACSTDDSITSNPDERESEPVEPANAADGQLAVMKVNTDSQRDVGGITTNDQTGRRKIVWSPVVKRAGGVSCQLDEMSMQNQIKLLNDDDDLELPSTSLM